MRIILAFCLLLYSCSVDDSQLKGYPVSLAFASQSVIVRDEPIAAAQIEAYMQGVVPAWGSRPQTRNALATMILSTASNFALDARLLTAMIAHESAFDARAVSPTGAVGLTQLTIAGLEEFLDQTGILYTNLGNRVYAGTGTAYFQIAIKKAWPEFPTARVLPDLAARTAWARELKAQTFADAQRFGPQIIAGTTILKAAITYCCAKQGQCSLAAIREGLERYNGDTSLRPDGEMVKVYYAKDILNRVNQI